ncbi:cAMP-binding domain of CRP or a regulatory subunit of cAMP-dependent protein kinases [Chryseobacterium soldanellicola]|uniref:cAMP-binding domain of CRP or a regulatory subunit of cAMP-dependent protein kinases n=1 Tax=Chryseobacterium soldanellicola TaxID=311333 RepID=A0A1H1GD23_9FLAO|nr:Crp/Fnr family transcriptional regulator [Chryseobacterium soldanellicola]SDR11192.1 cAMP-binding domain of CRP or a regulatory subunit of cAMP-dependent protein kinases [Chryseobacterium soldanellicola]
MKTISCMKIDEKILTSFGAEIKNYKPKEFIFQEGDMALFYYQTISGTVKINHYNEDGKEFIHNILGENQSFGDSPLFLDKEYPMNAVALAPSVIYKLPKGRFFQILEEYPETSIELNNCFSHRLHYQMLMMQNMASQNPIRRIKGLMDYLKSFHEKIDPFSFHIQLTRQQIADLTGLRVETIIRTLKKMEKENALKIENKQILY